MKDGFREVYGVPVVTTDFSFTLKPGFNVVTRHTEKVGAKRIRDWGLVWWDKDHIKVWNPEKTRGMMPGEDMELRRVVEIMADWASLGTVRRRMRQLSIGKSRKSGGHNR